MRISGIGYTFRQGFQNLMHNKWFSLASVATITACIFLFGLFYAIVENFNYSVRKAQEGVAVTVFFQEEISQEQIDFIGEAIRSRSEVSKVVFVTPEEAWEGYKNDFSQDAAALDDIFQEDNPLEGMANYEVYLKNVEGQHALVEYIQSLDGVRKVNQSEMAASVLSNFNRLIGYISVGIIAVLLMVSIFLISNTIAVGIAVRKEEIGIMKLIGAKDALVRAPFLLEGIVIGLLGSVIPLAVLYIGYQRVVSYVEEHFAILRNLITFLSVREIFAVLLPVSLAMGLGIGFLGSYVTVRKHLKV